LESLDVGDFAGHQELERVYCSWSFLNDCIGDLPLIEKANPCLPIPADHVGIGDEKRVLHEQITDVKGLFFVFPS
jgi:hypothetical protein